MTILDMLGQSAVLTVLGMGIVFGFLIIMVVCVSIMGKIIQGLEGNKAAVQTGAPSLQAGLAGTAGTGKSNTAVTAAITAAVTQYQKDNS
jgi:oxaloacetate decarboxylase gamma subunit